MQVKPELQARFEALKASGLLPSPRGVALAVMELTRQDNVNLIDMARTLEADPALVARLIKLANNCQMAGARPILAIKDAISLLGLRTVRGVALGLSLISQRPGSAGPQAAAAADFDYDRFWSRSLACAVAMRTFMARTRLMQPDEAFTLGLLARVGELGLASLFGPAYTALHARGSLPDAQQRAAEQQAFGFDHAELTALLLGDLGFPDGLVQAVVLHDAADPAASLQQARANQLLQTLRLAAQTADICMAAPQARAPLMPLLLQLGAQLQLTSDDLQALCDDSVHSWGDWCALLDVAAQQVPPFAELLASADAAHATDLSHGATGASVWADTAPADLQPDSAQLQHFAAEIRQLNQRLIESRQRDLENEQRMELALSGSNLGLWDWHLPSGKVTFNERWCSMLGYHLAELAPNLSTWQKLIHPDDAPAITAALNAHLNNQSKAYEIEHRLRHKNGDWVWVLDRGRVVARTPAGEALRMVGTHSDITERKQVEAELLRSNRELEQFSYSISHDMRQPLRMVNSYLQLLQKSLGESLGPEQQQYFQYAIDGAQRMDAMMLGLLEYSRVGRKGEPPAWVDSRALLSEALHFLQVSITESGAQVSVQGDWPRLWVSPDEGLRLLQNLVGNALKFRQPAQAPVVTLTGQSSPGQWALCVADNGVGLQPQQLGRLFQVFARLHARTAFEGTSIGLALCRKIVEHHGGRIWAASAGEGQGCQFHLTLPQPADPGV